MLSENETTSFYSHANIVDVGKLKKILTKTYTNITNRDK